MTGGILQALGGLGLFLFGMAIMTGALRSLADARLRLWLARCVNNPWKGAVTGALSTAVLQSSSATTVAAVGFAGAGLLTFSESLGIIFGANIGTTLTGWLVALVGFKLKLGQSLLPLILLGTLLRLTKRRRLEHFGMLIAGFGVIFVGIDVLQEGLAGLQGRITPDQFPPDTIPGRLLLVLIGLVITLVTQSSSAGVATALAAVHADAISLNQAAAMVIGMNLGTTATAALATLGGNVHARRTGFAHVIFNAITVVGAFLLLTPYMLFIDALFPGEKSAEPGLVLVGFHTLFNTLGVIAVIPFTTQFADLVERLIPERGNLLAGQLDRSLLAEPASAMTAVGGTLWDTSNVLLGELRRRLQTPATVADQSVLDDVSDAIKQTDDYVQELSARHRPLPNIQEFLADMHLLDYLRRIASRVREEQRLRRCRDDESLSAMSEQLLTAISIVTNAARPLSAEQAAEVRSINHVLKSAMRKYRTGIMTDTSTGTLTTSEAIQRMDTARTLRRIGYHLWRISHRLAELEAAELAVSASVEPAAETLNQSETDPAL